MSITVALVGRTNVGKSSLFNKLAKSKSAIVSEQEGLTRDIKSASIQEENKSINLIDTGGFFTSKDDAFEEMILSKAYEAIEIAELILFVVDKKFGISPFDKEIASFIRKSNKEVIMVINKIDVKTLEGTSIFEELGFREKIEVSAEHNLGIDKLKKLIFSKVKEEETFFENNIPKICILGKPNVGKSSTINSISNEKKMIVSDVPGTTIDSVDTKITYKNKDYMFIDTAGIRKKSKTISKEEKFSVIKSLESNKIADLSIIMLDASSFLLDQDKKLLEKARDNGRAIIIAVNKTDLLDKTSLDKIQKTLNDDSMFSGLPICFISAKKREGIRHLFDYVYRVLENVDKKISTNKLNNILRKALDTKSIPFKGKFKPKLRFVHQGGKNPHVITLHGNSLEKLEGSYKRFLNNFYQNKLGLLGITLKLKFITSKNPYKS
ncbi:MAG: ribosome biogenesis GTPase Der [Gammaproteobacteria bacterium TMED112]|nr:MAG: ribosome biogenesis GTPase Der [Gammaproteobacteria bacterium TMED112]|tara:strand:- start:6542 stop:7852 length:1311 start_codon:yes stop_codon:yes gene_type:complete